MCLHGEHLCYLDEVAAFHSPGHGPRSWADACGEHRVHTIALFGDVRDGECGGKELSGCVSLTPGDCRIAHSMVKSFPGSYSEWTQII